MNATTMKKMTINRYYDGEILGTAKVNKELYTAEAQWPEGIIEAGKLLFAGDLVRLGLKRTEVIYLD